MRKECNIVKDLLPLYAEHLVSEDTESFVEEHLKTCGECRRELKKIQTPAQLAPDVNTAPLKTLKKKLLLKKIQTIVFTAAFVLAVAISVFSVLTSPDYLPYSDRLMQVTEAPGGTISIVFDDSVTGYSCTEALDSSTNATIYQISAWNTTWDLHVSNRGTQTVLIPSNSETDIQVYYCQNNGSEDILIYGSSDAGGGTMALPRLFLMPYFLMALITFAVLIILRLVLRNKKTVTVWINRAIFLPVSYMLAHICTKGFCFRTYSPQRDFFIILLVAIFFYCAILSGIRLYQSGRERKKQA